MKGNTNPSSAGFGIRPRSHIPGRHTNQGIRSTRGDRRIQVILYGNALSKYFYRRNGISRKTREYVCVQDMEKVWRPGSSDKNLGRKILTCYFARMD